MSDASMAGRVCLVTGGTSGIGVVAARELARRGAHVLIVGRSPERCAAAADKLRRDTGSSQVYPMHADLSSHREVRRLADEFRTRFDRLDVLVNNAGAMFELRCQSVDGIEMTMALNHLGPFLLTNLLLDPLRAAGSSRVVVVSSAGHKDVPGLDFEDPEARSKRPWRGAYPTTNGRSLLYALGAPWAHPAFLQYAHSKLANLLFTLELSRRLAGTGATVNSLHPGLVATGFASGTGPYTWFLGKMLRFFGRTPERGAETIVYLATSPDVQGVTGRYFIDCKEADPSPAAKDADAARRLWEWSELRTR